MAQVAVQWAEHWAWIELDLPLDMLVTEESISLVLSFLICEMGLMIVPMVWDCHRQYELTHRKAREQHLAHGDCSVSISNDDDKRGDGGSQSKLACKRE